MRFLTIFLLFSAALAAGDTFVVKSTNGGKTWVDVDPGAADRFLWWFQVDSHSSTLYSLTQRDLGEEWHLSVSIDGGQTWQIKQSFPHEIYRIPAAAATGTHDTADTLYLAYEVYGYPQTKVTIVKVTDRGETMQQYPAEGLVVIKGGVYYGVLATLKADPHNAEKLYALVTANPGNDEIFARFQALWVSVDGGRNWERLEPPVGDGCLYPELQIDSFDSSVYQVCGNELFKSTDSGRSWSARPFPNAERLWNLQSGPGEPAALFGTRLGVIWKSNDGADSWQRLGTLPLASGATFLTPHPVDSSLLLAATVDGVAKSEDGGGTWASVTEASLMLHDAFLLVISPQSPNDYYLVNWRKQPVHLEP
jgi:photosystem II stability/assembly factor-like uncharacterized protein